jgi:hypothetical protein
VSCCAGRAARPNEPDALRETFCVRSSESVKSGLRPDPEPTQSKTWFTKSSNEPRRKVSCTKPQDVSGLADEPAHQPELGLSLSDSNELTMLPCCGSSAPIFHHETGGSVRPPGRIAPHTAQIAAMHTRRPLRVTVSDQIGGPILARLSVRSSCMS